MKINREYHSINPMQSRPVRLLSGEMIQWCSNPGHQ